MVKLVRVMSSLEWRDEIKKQTDTYIKCPYFNSRFEQQLLSLQCAKTSHIQRSIINVTLNRDFMVLKLKAWNKDFFVCPCSRTIRIQITIFALED